MPEYLAPGVYVEETSFRSKSIEGVSTTTTGFIGPCRYGPVDIGPDILTSLGDYERTYGGRKKLKFGNDEIHNYMWHASRAFFAEGGRRLYISRIFNPTANKNANNTSKLYKRPVGNIQDDFSHAPTDSLYEDGHARGWLSDGETGRPASNANLAKVLQVRARFPGAYGNFTVRFELRASRNILLSGGKSVKLAGNLQEHDIVWVGDVQSPISSPPGHGSLYRAERDTESGDWCFRNASGDLSSPPGINALVPDVDLSDFHAVYILTVTVTLFDQDGQVLDTWSDLPLDPAHRRGGSDNSLFAQFEINPANGARARQLPIAILRGTGLENGVDVTTAIFGSVLTIRQSSPISTIGQQLIKGEISKDLRLSGGNDGELPSGNEYEGLDNVSDLIKTGLKQFEDLEDISIVAAPGATHNYDSRESQALDILGRLIGHASRMQYRIAVLDSGSSQSISDVRDMRAKFDSSHAALYYPWIKVMDPVTRVEVDLPPSGFVAGIYARNDTNRAVYKAPANEVVNLALGFESMLNKNQQDVLNPEGINCFRFFEGRGMRLWGARTISSDPEWKYVNLRRYFAYLERSIDKGTQWAVFEPNGERLWANVRRTIQDFLLNEWQNGALLGDKPEQAFFVKCDRGTMSQNDLDNGRLICEIGVAALRPAEFVVFKIGQWTGDRRA